MPTQVHGIIPAKRLDNLRYAIRDLAVYMSCVQPRGAFYAFPRIDIPEPDDVFVKELLLQKHILVVHGSGFGQRSGSKHFRVVFLPHEDVLKEACRVIQDFMIDRYS